MKKRIVLIILALACLLILSACGCEHEWIEANCVNPRTCSLCEETEGAPLGHSWLAATCSAAKTCENCGEVQGEPLEHTWTDATCTAPKTCSVCSVTEGDPLEHSWVEATYEEPKTCSVCALTEGEPLDPVLNSQTYATVVEAIDANMAEFDPQYEYVAEDGILYIYLTAPEGTAESILNDAEGIAEVWESVVEQLVELCSIVQEAFDTEGIEVSCCVVMLNDANTENVLLGILGGEVIYDVMSE